MEAIFLLFLIAWWIDCRIADKRRRRELDRLWEEARIACEEAVRATKQA